MREQVQSGKFREDLFYRLNVFPLYISPLRDRPGDIISLAQGFFDKHLIATGSMQPHFPELEQSAIDRLLSHSWPGNVRELDNVIQRALILRRSDNIVAEDIQFEQEFDDASVLMQPVEDAPTDGNKYLGEEVKDHEYQRILEVLNSEMGNRQIVAEKLGISQRTLRYKLAKMRDQGIQIPGRSGAELNP